MLNYFLIFICIPNCTLYHYVCFYEIFRIDFVESLFMPFYSDLEGILGYLVYLKNKNGNPQTNKNA